MTMIDWAVAAAEMFEPPPRHWATPGDLARELMPNIVQTPALQLIDQHLVRAADSKNARLIVSMPPQEGKSERCSKIFPLWLLTQNKNCRIAIVSYQHEIARRWGRETRDLATMFPELGIKVRPDVSAQSEWQVDGTNGGIFCTGIGGPLTSRAVDWLIIDDPIANQQDADSKTFRERNWAWFQTVAQTRLAPGAGVLLIQTRWHEDDLAGRLLDPENNSPGSHPWTFLNIPAQAGLDDPLGREDGEWLLSARGRTVEDWEAKKAATAPKYWSAMFQGQPTPDDGGLFPPEKWGRWAELDLSKGIDDSLTSWDLTFKGTEDSDYCVGQYWIRQGANCYLIDQVRGRWNFTQQLEQIAAFVTKWPASRHLVEDKANGSAAIDMLRSTIPGILPVNPRGDKQTRASAISGFQNAGNLLIPEKAEWVRGFVEETSTFPGKNDDQVDAMSQAIAHMLLPARGIGTTLYNPR